MNLDHIFQLGYLLLLAVGGYAIGKLFQNTKSTDRLALLQRLVRLAVEKVEQTGYLSTSGKKEQAIKVAREIFAKYKIDVSFEELDALIEQAVLHMNLHTGKLPKERQE